MTDEIAFHGDASAGHFVLRLTPARMEELGIAVQREYEDKQDGTAPRCVGARLVNLGPGYPGVAKL